nr:cupin domain-containing protein [uncultured Duganella sp.]
METIELYPAGYPVYIDVAQDSIHGIGTAIRFELPVHGVNFPLSHQHEKKLIVALAGQLEIKAAGKLMAHLNAGQGLLLPTGTAHRVAQAGNAPSMVGVALWPGAVEGAFRAVAQHVASSRFSRQTVIDLFAEYGVLWQTGATGDTQDASHPPVSFDRLLQQLPGELAQSLAASWDGWIKQWPVSNDIKVTP